MNENFDSLDEIQISRIVHFVIPSGKCRPAIVTEDWKESGKPGYVNLVVFPDGSNDGKYGVDDHTHRMDNRDPSLPKEESMNVGWRTGIANLPLLTGWETSVLPNHAVRAVRTWHWGRECNKLHTPPEPFVDDEKIVYHHNHVDGIVDPHNCQGCIAQARYVKENIP